MPEERPELRLTRLDQSGPRLGLPVLVTLAVLGILIALWKPWAGEGTGGPTAERAARPGPAEPRDRSRPAPSPLSPEPTRDPSAIPCIGRTGWRVVAVERNQGRETRTWIAVEPVAASGPGERAIPVVRVVTERLLGLGFCTPEESDTAWGRLRASLWRIDPSGAPVALRGVRRIAPVSSGTSEVYGPPPGVGRAWPPGRYVFGFGDRSRPRWSAWFAVEVVSAPRLPAGPP